MSRDFEGHGDHGDHGEHGGRGSYEDHEGGDPFVGADDDGAMGAPDVVAARDRVLATLLEFTRELERAGAEVPANASVNGARALVEVGFGSEERARAALRATLVSREADLETFDRLFEVLWRRLTDHLSGMDSEGEDRRENVGGFAPIGAEPNPKEAAEATVDPDEEESSASSANWRPAASAVENEADEDDSIRTALYSPTGRSERLAMPAGMLRGQESLDRILGRLTQALASIGGRRWESGGRDRADVRRALRRSFGTGGTVVSVPRRERAETAVRCVLLVDVSRSVLDTIDRAFLIRFLRAATAEWRTVRTFLFDTDVREVSTELAAPSPDATIEALDRAETEWGGGTRIADAIDTVRREHPDAIDRRTTVFVISDGLETGEVDALENGMSWLSRRARVVLWANPLASAPGYEPTARGMAVSMPYVDGLFAFGRPDDLAEIARQLERQGTTAIGYEHDPRRWTRE